MVENSRKPRNLPSVAASSPVQPPMQEVASRAHASMLSDSSHLSPPPPATGTYVKLIEAVTLLNGNTLPTVRATFWQPPHQTCPYQRKSTGAVSERREKRTAAIEAK